MINNLPIKIDNGYASVDSQRLLTILIECKFKFTDMRINGFHMAHRAMELLQIFRFCIVIMLIKQ